MLKRTHTIPVIPALLTKYLESQKRIYQNDRSVKLMCIAKIQTYLELTLWSTPCRNVRRQWTRLNPASLIFIMPYCFRC